MITSGPTNFLPRPLVRDEPHRRAGHQLTVGPLDVTGETILHIGTQFTSVRYGGRLAELYALGTPIEEREDTPDGVLVVARLPRRELPRFASFLIAESRSHRESA